MSEPTSYENQLRQLFTAFCPSESEILPVRSLQKLCQSLQLESAQQRRLGRALDAQGVGDNVDFDAFKEALVSILSSDDEDNVDNHVDNNVDSDEKERQEERWRDTGNEEKPQRVECLEIEEDELFSRPLEAEIAGDDIDAFVQRHKHHLSSETLSSVPGCSTVSELQTLLAMSEEKCLDPFGNDHHQVETADLRSRRRASSVKKRASEEISDDVLGSDNYTFFSAIDQNRTGLAEIELVCSYLGSLSSCSSLSSLLESKWQLSSPIDLRRLTNLMERELEQPKSNLALRVSTSACVHEVRVLSHARDVHQRENDKLRSDLADANRRAEMFANEIDEHNRKADELAQQSLRELESRHLAQVRELQTRLRSEQEELGLLRIQVDREREERHNLDAEHELKIRKEMDIIKHEVDRLECENARLQQLLSESESLVNRLQRELELLKSSSNMEEIDLDEKRLEKMGEELEKMAKVNKDLKDHNDELTIMLERIRQESCSSLATVEGDRTRSESTRGGSGRRLATSTTWASTRRRSGRRNHKGMERMNSLDLELSDAVERRAESGVDHESKVRMGNHVAVEMAVEATEKEDNNDNNDNQILASRLSSSESECSSLRQQLERAMHDLEDANAGRFEAEQRFRQLEAKCASMEERLRDSALSLNSPTSSLSRCSSNISSPSTTIRSSSSKENVQIIAVRAQSKALKTSTNSSTTSSATSSTTSSSTGSSTGSSAGSASPCISKVLLNSEEPSLGSDMVGTLSSSSSKTSSLSQPFSLQLLKRTRSVSSPSEMVELEQHCRHLEGELDHVKAAIVRILSDKSVQSRENETLKQYAKAYEELRDENLALKQRLSENKKGKMSKDKQIPINESTKNDSKEAKSNNESCGNDEESRRRDHRSSPDGQEELLLKQVSNEEKERLLQERLEQLEQREQALEQKEKELGSNSKKLQESLEEMQREFEGMEDYWQGKLEDERAFYEAQLAASDASFRELEQKMKEYDDLVLKEDSKKSLSTIVETASLEGQVTELEEEKNELRLRLEETERLWVRDKEARAKLEERLDDLQHDLKEAHKQNEIVRSERDAALAKLAGLSSASEPTCTSLPPMTSAALDISTWEERFAENNSGSLSLDAAGKRLGGCHALQSVATAFKMMLRDISREEASVQADLESLQRPRKSTNPTNNHRKSTRTTSLNNNLSHFNHHLNNSETNLSNDIKRLRRRLQEQEKRVHEVRAQIDQHQRLIADALKGQHETNLREVRRLEEWMRLNEQIFSTRLASFESDAQELSMSQSAVHDLGKECDNLGEKLNNHLDMLNKLNSNTRSQRGINDSNHSNKIGSKGAS